MKTQPAGSPAISRTTPINDGRNPKLHKEYRKLAEQEGDVVFAGRLDGCKYYDMDKAIAAAFDVVKAALDVEL